MNDGATALTRMPNGANSIAELFVIASSPALLMQYPRRPGSGRLPLSQLTLTMQPLEACKYSKKSYESTNGVRMLISIIRSYSYGSVDSKSPASISPTCNKNKMLTTFRIYLPAQFIRISSRPWVSATDFFTSNKACSSVRSHWTAKA